MINVRPVDRFLRSTIGILLLEAGYFWLGSPWSWICLTLGLILLLTGVIGICPIYRLLGLASIAPNAGKGHPLLTGAAILTLLVIALGGSYASIFFTRKLFLEDFNAMNEHYKQALFLSGKGDREGAVSNLDELEPVFEAFSRKYTNYRPYALKGDGELSRDFASVGQILTVADPLVRSGDLHEAHLALEKVRPVFQNMFKRNGFSMLSVALVDFHDAMETILGAATAKDVAGVASIYPSVSDKLKAIEAEDNDAEIQNIRQALEALLSAAQSGDSESLPGKGDKLKSNFITVYLKRG
jgi:hypothetical protein